MLRDGQRQVAPILDGIRGDHLARYRWAARTLSPRSRVVDVACGVGYGASILADAGHRVLAIDNDPEAIAYAREHYARRGVHYRLGDAATLALPADFDAATCFETIEHLADPAPLLAALCRAAPVLLASVPNEAVFPFRGYLHHHRHYTAAEFDALLSACGWRATERFGQAGPHSDLTLDSEGRTIVVAAKRARPGARPKHRPARPAATPAIEVASDRHPGPKHVVILGLGPTLEAYVDLVKRFGGRGRFCDEVWGLNAVGGVLQCDRIFHMDDVRIQEIRAAAKPQSNIAGMLDWLRVHPGPVYTSVPPLGSQYRGLVAYPLQNVINAVGFAYFNSTAAYAVAFAIAAGVEKISLFGIDFTYPNSHQAEKGRANVEFLLGIAAARGIEIALPGKTSLMDAIEGEQLYGYDLVTVKVEQQAPGMPAMVTFTDRDDPLPTAEEIERRYDHSAHPNPLVRPTGES